MKNLVEERFSDAQINQILKIRELGFDCTPYIDNNVDVNDLRKLRCLLFKDEYTKAQRKLICHYFINDNFDITKFYDLGIKYQNVIKLLYNIQKDNLDITPFLDNTLTYEKLVLMEKYYRNGIDIKEYIKKNYNEEQIKLILSLKEKGYDYGKLEDNGYNFAQINAINNMLVITKKDILSFIDNSYNAKQIEQIAHAINQNVDITKVLNPDYHASVMRIIIDGLSQGYDITPYLEKGSIKEYADAILKALRNNIDPTLYKKIKDPKKYKIFGLFLESNIDMSKIDVNDYTVEQLRYIIGIFAIAKKNKDIDIKQILNKNYSVFQMQSIVKLMLIKKDVSILQNEKLSDRQIKAIINANDVDLSGLIDETTDPSLIEAIAKCLRSGYNIKKRA